MLLRRIPIRADQFGRGEVVLGLRTRRLAAWKAEALLHASAIADAASNLSVQLQELIDAAPKA